MEAIRRRGACRTIACLILCGCIGKSSEPLGNIDHILAGEDEPESEHRPGQTCLSCHSYEVAGTVYRCQGETTLPCSGNIDSHEGACGLSGAIVTVTDSSGFTATATTNATGNFFFHTQGEDDGTEIPAAFAYPLQTKISFEGAEKIMEGFIERTGSCATCHEKESANDSPGRVFLFERGEALCPE